MFRFLKSSAAIDQQPHLLAHGRHDGLAAFRVLRDQQLPHAADLAQHPEPSAASPRIQPACALAEAAQRPQQRQRLLRARGSVLSVRAAGTTTVVEWQARRTWWEPCQSLVCA